MNSNPQIQQYVMGAMQNQQLMNNNNFANAVNMYRNHQSQNLREYASNLCREYGMTYEQAVQRLQGR